MYIIVRDRVYTFYDHAVARMKKWQIPFTWIEAALLEPDDIVDLTPTRRAYDKDIEAFSIRVVVDEEASTVVTVWRDERG